MYKALEEHELEMDLGIKVADIVSAASFVIHAIEPLGCSKTPPSGFRPP
jgi:hypothetical protein